MKIDYGTLLSPDPIKLSIGSIRKHRLRDLSKITFDKFYVYEAFLKMTPEKFYSNQYNEDGSPIWDTIKNKDSLTMYDLICSDEVVRKTYVEILNFFFEECVDYKEGFFILSAEAVDFENEISPNSICGVIDRSSFKQVLSLIQQVCCIFEDDEEPEENVKFKNSAARKIYEKLLSAQKKEKKRKKADINLSLPNIISAVSNCHPTINPINVWDLTLFQLFDTFNRMRANKIYDIDSTRVSVWGDEKKTFDIALWYKNEYDKK